MQVDAKSPRYGLRNGRGVMAYNYISLDLNNIEDAGAYRCEHGEFKTLEEVKRHMISDARNYIYALHEYIKEVRSLKAPDVPNETILRGIDK